MSSNNRRDRVDRRDVLAYRVAKGMGADRQHVCSATSFEPFPDSALERSIVDRFAEQVSRHRECVAVVDRGRTLSYGQLDAWANGIAHGIGTRAITDDPVALLVEQGAAYAAAVLGTLKSGRPYVPLDPSDPDRRLGAFIRGCDAGLVLTDAENRGLAARVAGQAAIVCVDESSPRERGAEHRVDPGAVAYVFFTSGSTGTPKGVYDSHRNVLHNVLRYTNALEISPADRLTLLQGPAFSGCVSSQLGALLNGAASLPFRLADQGLVGAAQWLRYERITIYHSVPSIFRAIVGQGGAFPNVRVVRLEGDRASSEDVEIWKRHFSKDCLLANGLGTTETGLARQLILRKGDSLPPRGVLPVGYAIRDLDVDIVDDDHTPLPAGAVGEISVAGDYLALGYWKRPDLTSERFELRDGRRRYFTGDLGRLTADGCLEYLGRKEGDLKVLGTRIEPAEIERELLCMDGVREAAVVVRTGWRGDGRVIAYIVTARPDRFDLATIRAQLAEALPAAMLPTAVVELDALPLGPNGKVDRGALPEPPETSATRTTETADERWLAAIWADVLGVEVGAGDDFFALGGDSLAAAEIVAKIESQTGSTVPLSTLAGAPTVSELATALGSVRASGSTIVLLHEGADAPTLYLVHGITGNALRYVDLVRRLGPDVPVSALEYLGTEDFRIESIAARHVDAMLEADPVGPYFLGGFCYGAVIAREMARQLTARQGNVAFLALLGITPLDFPTLVSPDAAGRWTSYVGSGPRLVRDIRRHLRRATELSGSEGVRYVARRGVNLLSRPIRRRYPYVAKVDGALAVHAPGPYDGHAVVFLHVDDTRPYTDDPERDWAGLAGTVEVVMFPGRDHSMLAEPGVAMLAEILRERIARVATVDPVLH